MLHRHSLILRGLISLMFLSFFVNYFAYLSLGKFSYSLNMITNVVTGKIICMKILNMLSLKNNHIFIIRIFFYH